MEPNLAIVIPAYKADFLRESLQSISNQSCKDFTLYIGDDNSPSNLYEIVEEFTNKLKIRYKRFPANLGGHDLVEQWNRCIDLVQDEEWIWFFSDDDIMEKNCVEQFYRELDKNPTANLFHFNVKVIDPKGDVIKNPIPFPLHLDISTFHLHRWQSKISNYVVEFIFSKRSFKDKGGFQKFNYAWHTDEATWTKLGFPNGIITINDANVMWRRSEVNITPNNSDGKIVIGKLEADINFSKWVVHFYELNQMYLSFEHRYYLAKRFSDHLAVSKNAIPANTWRKYLKIQLKELRITYLYPIFYLYFNYRFLKYTIN